MTGVALPRYGASGRGPSVRVIVPLLAGGALAGLIAGQLVASGRTAVVLALGLVMVPVVLWNKPELGPATFVVAALGVEQFDHFGGVGPAAAAVTARIPLFHGIGFAPVNPADLLVALLFAIAIAKSGTGPSPAWGRSAMSTAMFCLLAVVLFGVLVGLANGGEMRIAFLEARPYVYLVSTFVLASALLTTRAAIRALLWGLVIAIGFKAVQGLVIFLSFRGGAARPEAVLGHEEALFFALFLLLTVALWLFEVRGALRTTATFLAPVVLAADLANARRAAWVVLIVGFATLAIIGFVTQPARRRFLGRILITLSLVLALYLPAYWDRTGGFAQPARAVRSAVAPSARDESSNLYRIQEDANLQLNIRQAGPLGVGFGIPIHYALPIVDLTQSNPFIAYIPHNGVLYILLRMGPLGGIAFWSMLGIGILTACRVARSRDRELAVVGAVVASSLVAYAFEGQLDQGFFFYRIAFVVGALLGVTEAARRLSAAGVARAIPAAGSGRA